MCLSFSLILSLVLTVTLFFLQLLLFLVQNYILLFEHRHHRKIDEILSAVLADFFFGQLARL